LRTIAVCSFKGGVGKTTLAVSLAVSLMMRLKPGKRILLVDNDPQANCSATMLDGAEPDEPTLADLLHQEVSTQEVLRPSRLEGIDLLPASYTLADVPTTLASEMGRELRLKLALAAVADRYEVCLIDSAAQQNLLAINSLEAASEILVPIDHSFYSLSGIAKLEETVAAIRKHLGHESLRIIGVCLCKWPPASNRVAEEFEAVLRKRYGVMILTTKIPESVRVAQAIARHRTVLETAPSSAVAIAFNDLVAEVLRHDHKKAPKHRATRRRQRRAG
jgi:chromosome partitioning protein